MIDAVFISDLHLHPDDKDILGRFNNFVKWAHNSVKKIYILGDFFHAWAGDDSLDEWSLNIANQLNLLSKSGISIFYLCGNRDFLLGPTFAKHAGWNILFEPTVIQLGSEQILLAHGDRYCTKDKAHQRFRLLTRNHLFPRLFLLLPLVFRQRLVNKVRIISQSNQNKSLEQIEVVDEVIVKEMQHYKVTTLIHGHTHQYGLKYYENNGLRLKRYILSDWDDKPKLLCYDKTKGLLFNPL